MSIPRFHCHCAIARIAVAAFVGIVSDRVNAAGWDSIPTFPGSFAVEMNLPGPSTRIAGASGVWVRYAPTLSVDCSPPRGCYANTQRIYYNFSCTPRYIILLERISIDLNGTIVKHEVQEAAPTYTLAHDGVATWVLDAFCPLPDRN